MFKLKREYLLIALFLLSMPCFAQTGAFNKFCSQGATQSITSGSKSSNYLDGVIPKCTVTVYIDGVYAVNAATYFSGATVTGSSGQTCNATFLGGTVNGVGTISLTGINTINVGSSFTIPIANGQYINAPTTATLSNGTATCSGTVTITSSITPALATIYSNSSNLSLTNPFTANADGSWLFYANNGVTYNATMSGGGGNPSCVTQPNCYATPKTITGLINGGGSGGGVSQIIAGTNVSVSPVGGTGVVTVNSTGGVSEFLAPFVSWPSWLVPTVTNATTTPSLSVAAGVVPTSNGGTGATTEAGAAANIVDGQAITPASVTSPGTVQAATVTDGTASIHSGSITGAVNGTFSGTVAAGATVSNIAGPVVNLLQYAACDGVTDDRVAIGNALAIAGSLASSTGSAYIYVPDGRVCLINSNPNSTISLNALEILAPGVGIKGSGTIKIGNGINFDSLFAWTSPPTAATYQDFTVDLNGANNPMLSDPNLGSINRRSAFSSAVGSGNGIRFYNITFKNGNGVWSITTSNIDEVTVDSCHWVNWGLNSSVSFDSSLIYTNPVNGGSTVVNNDFTSGGPALHSAIEVHNSDAVIEGNRVYGFDYGIIYSANPATVGAMSSLLNITGNVLYVKSGGILLFLQTGPLDTAIISDNIVYMDRQNIATNFPINGVEQGISWYFGVSPGYSLSNAKINNNQVTWANETSAQVVLAQLAGLSLWSNGTGTRNLVNVEVAGNTVSNSPSACYTIYPNNITGLTVRNNIAINCTATTATLPAGPTDGGFVFQLPSGGKVVDLIVENNHVFDTRATTKLQAGFQWIGTSGDGAPLGASFVGNTVAYVGAPNAYFNFYYSGPLVNLVAPNAFSSGAVNFVSMTTGNYTPFGSVVTDSTTAIPYTNTNANGLTWNPTYIANPTLFGTTLFNCTSGNLNLNLASSGSVGWQWSTPCAAPGQLNLYSVGASENVMTFNYLTGAVGLPGVIQTGGYKSSDGTAGFTGTCAAATVATVKNGLIVGCS